MKHVVLFSAFLAGISSLAIIGCTPGQETPKASQEVVKKYSKAGFLEGEISNNQGLIKSGKLVASNENGHVISHVEVNNGHYRVEIPAETILPIILTFTSPAISEELLAVVIRDSITQYAINPTTTAIAKVAKSMGGYSTANMSFATQKSVHTPDANKTTTGWRGDPTTQYGGWH